MKLDISGVITTNNPEKINHNSSIMVYTNRISGILSHKMCIEIVNEKGEDINDSICMEFNKNEALYLMKFLSAFIAEKDIDINEED